MSANREEVAYQLYKSLGKERTYGRVAELMGKSEKTIRDYGVRGKWQNRLDSDFLLKAEEINKKREELERLGFDVAIAALTKLKEQIDSGKGLSKEKAQIFEIYLSCPLSLIGNAESGQIQSAGDTNSGNGKEKIEIILDINGGVSSED